MMPPARTDEPLGGESQSVGDALLSSLWIDSARSYTGNIPLKSEFRFAHEPILFRDRPNSGAGAAKARFVGRERELREMIQRIVLSEGGAFLVTGYRGVGKTSFVNRTVQEIRELLARLADRYGRIRVVDIYLNLARPLVPMELMHHIVRSLYCRLDEMGMLPWLDSEVREALVLAYQRTSMTIMRKVGQSSERGIGISDLALSPQFLGVTPKLSASTKRSRSEGLDMSFLHYEDKAAEYDIIRLLNRLPNGYTPPLGRARRFWRRIRRQPPEPVGLKTIYVFDELDKLEEFTASNGRPVIDDILSALKNLFTTSGVTFIFVGGKDLHERWVEDLGKGDSVYESVFAFHKYLPAMWADTGTICDNLVDTSAVETGSHGPTVAPSLPPRPTSLAPPIASPHTSTEDGPFATANVDLDVWSGPGRSYSKLGTIRPGVRHRIIGRIDDNSWLGITYPDASHRGWISAQFVRVSGSLAPAEIVCPTIQLSGSAPQAEVAAPLAEPLRVDASIPVPPPQIAAEDRTIWPLTPGLLYSREYTDFKLFLAFKGRGIPRSILRTFHQYVRWDGLRPFLAFDGSDQRRIRSYAELQKAIEEEERNLVGNVFEDVQGEWQDKRRLLNYYLVDWIVKRRERAFSQSDAIAAARQLSARIAPAEEDAEAIVRAIIESLLRHNYLEQVQRNPAQVIVGNIGHILEDRYRIPRKRLIEMGDRPEEPDYRPSFSPATTAMPSVNSERYQLRSLIATGGMSEVYRAWDMVDNREVAVKLLSAAGGYASAKFKQEFQLLSRLQNPHLVRAYHYDESRDRPYMSLEFIDGPGLDTVLRATGKLDLDTTLSIVRPIAEAVAYLHSQGIVRCDIKPNNILLNRQGHVFLIDLGIARLDNKQSEAATLAGDVVGTPQYMAPEQARGLPVDNRADIYALGIVFYQLLTDQLPYDVTQPIDFVQAQISQPPIPPSQRGATVPAEVEAVILKCLEKDAAARFQEMAEFLAALPETRGVRLADLVADVLEQQYRVESNEREVTQPFSVPQPIVGSPAPPAPETSDDTRIPIPAAAMPDFAFQLDDTGIPADMVAHPSLERPAERLSAAEGVDPRQAHLGVDRGAEAGRLYAVHASGKTTIGRSIENDIPLTHEKRMSRYHASIERLPDGRFELQDLNSGNGTIVNDVPIAEPICLTDGDRIRIGETVLRFVLPESTRS